MPDEPRDPAAPTVDLNCDLGEGCAFDDAVMPLITSASIACGGHAGDPESMRHALRSAARFGVRVGAHPSYPDRANFGRLDMDRSPADIRDDCRRQIAELKRLADETGVRVAYVKPHGALYNRACRDEAIAAAVVDVARELGLAVMGLPGSALQRAAVAAGLTFLAEGFADRRYQGDGSLVPRNRPDAFVETAAEAVEQAERLIRERGVRTLCVHGDNPQALEFVAALRQGLLQRGFTIG